MGKGQDARYREFFWGVKKSHYSSGNRVGREHIELSWNKVQLQRTQGIKPDEILLRACDRSPQWGRAILPSALGCLYMGRRKRRIYGFSDGYEPLYVHKPKVQWHTHSGVLELSQETEQVLGKDVSAPHLESTGKIPHTHETRLEQSSLVPSLSMWIRSRTCRISLLCVLRAVVRGFSGWCVTNSSLEEQPRHSNSKCKINMLLQQKAS